MLTTKDIPSLVCSPHYRSDIPLDHLPENTTRYLKMGLDLNPDFQRGHVWTEALQYRYVEFLFRGGKGPDIQLNHPGWMKSYKGHFVIVDGKQRMTACLKFAEGKLRIFRGLAGKTEGWAIQEIENAVLRRVSVGLAVNNLESREEVLQWYLELNEGAVAHTPEELARVKELLNQSIGLNPN